MVLAELVLMKQLLGERELGSPGDGCASASRADSQRIRRWLGGAIFGHSIDQSGRAGLGSERNSRRLLWMSWGFCEASSRQAGRQQCQ